jgi:hypothetical protein
MNPPEKTPPHKRSEFVDSLQKGFLLGAAVLLLIMPPARHYFSPPTPALAVVSPPKAAPAISSLTLPGKLAAFGREQPSADARQIADWALYSGDNQNMSVVIVDKKQARVYVFSPQGELRGATPALLGAARGDDSVPGIGNKPIAQVLPEERTTPAGRFVAEPGVNTNGEDIVWVDYDAAVSMHRVRAHVKAERRLERLASPTPEDNRISYGCINLPKAFYENVLSPTVKATGAVIYVLPETRPARELFSSYEVPVAAQLAQR